MDGTDRHPVTPDASFDGGDLDCGSGLLLLIRKHLDPLQPDQVLEILSTESSVADDLPSWARLTGNELISQTRQGERRSFLVRKAKPVQRRDAVDQEGPARPESATWASSGSSPSRSAPLAPFSVMGIGSWPRPRWLLRAIHDSLEGRLSEDEFQHTANDAVRLAIAAQERAGVDVITDGEQRRDSYASFVGSRIDNCQLVPITDLLPYVSDPEKFAKDLQALDVPANTVRQAVVRGRLRRNRPIAGHELDFAASITSKPVKIALPGPYLLTRMLSLECVSDETYSDREALAVDIVEILRQEATALLASGVALVQFDEPVLTEIVFGRPAKDRTFMCGALAERRDPEEELAFAAGLLHRVAQGLPKERLAIHICRGNWSRDESVALSGNYSPLVPLLKTLSIGTFFLELCTERAGKIDVLRDLPGDCKIGIGVVNQKLDRVETVAEIVAHAEEAVSLFGPERVLLNPDCGFATFADSPIASTEVAEAKLTSMVHASRLLRKKYLVQASPGH
jgi:5-methyltetrahydropteroyltriglutamate--homocysteine methyltransferase